MVSACCPHSDQPSDRKIFRGWNTDVGIVNSCADRDGIRVVVDAVVPGATDTYWLMVPANTAVGAWERSILDFLARTQ
ncbi:hypothetical protein [Candidatus Pollutiaquabacter sp.]|uniref:hypothetical protein n=1 Tax=Candidatus Pollutiaquabacter sp. TaxID=3416354 RepID=UPI003C9606E8|nr:hypothetical protein [Bacteroidota bacterium]